MAQVVDADGGETGRDSGALPGREGLPVGVGDRATLDRLNLGRLLVAVLPLPPARDDRQA
ncbi:MAG: hypothetical protein ACOCUS_03665 [Polyangiales bacterium]